jgi:opacity protein-like surface antigen
MLIGNRSQIKNLKIMKKLVLSLFAGIFTLIPSITNAQAFEQGKSQISIGYGFANTTQALLSNYDQTLYPNLEFSALGPLFLKYEFGATEKIGFGLNVAYAGAGITYDDGTGIGTASLDWWGISYNARVNRHFGSHDKFDPYIGVGMGYKMAKWTASADDESEDMGALIPLGFETTFGARYMFTPNIGLYTEVGIAKAIAQFGINAKF